MNEAAQELKAIQAVNRAMGALSGPSIRRVWNFCSDLQAERVVAYEKELADAEQAKADPAAAVAS